MVDIKVRDDRLKAILNYDFDIVHESGIRLREIIERDFPDLTEDKYPICIGGNDYVVRAVIEALFT